jgi:hypothetical protein
MVKLKTSPEIFAKGNYFSALISELDGAKFRGKKLSIYEFRCVQQIRPHAHCCRQVSAIFVE